MVLGYRMGILLAATPLPQVCQEASSGHGQFTVRISVDSGSLPFSAISTAGNITTWRAGRRYVRPR